MSSAPRDRSGLSVSGLTVSYGGNVAVDDVSFTAPRGQITGLIGPNGAGKTTSFNACTGIVSPASGSVYLDGEDITDLPTHRRAQRGIGRTFQKMELFDSMSVAENVAMGREAVLAGSRPLRHLRMSRAEAEDVRSATVRAAKVCGIEPLLARQASAVSTGQRRLVELARVVACQRSVLLLDEPSSGLDSRETSAFGDVLLSLVDSMDVGILLVEHDMGLVMRVCAHLFVLDFGRLLFEGSAQEAQASEVVRRAYLGEEG